MVDHKAIREELKYCEENKLSVTSVSTLELRQLLDEIQALIKFNEELRGALEIERDMANVELLAQAKEIERLEIALHTYKSCDKSAVDLYYENQAQAKEIERLKTQLAEETRITERVLRSEELQRNRFKDEIEQLQADKAAAVEALKFYAGKMCIQKEDVGWNTGYIARRALQRIESGDTDETR